MSDENRSSGTNWLPFRLVPALHRLGWILFLISAVLFATAGIRSGDWLVVAGSVVFGGACVLFLWPDS